MKNSNEEIFHLIKLEICKKTGNYDVSVIKEGSYLDCLGELEREADYVVLRDFNSQVFHTPDYKYKYAII